MTLLIVGASSSIGTRVAEKLLSDSPSLKIISCGRSKPSSQVNWGGHISLDLADIPAEDEYTSLDSALESSDIVLLLAAVVHRKGVPAQVYDSINVDGPVRLYERYSRRRGISGQFVFASSVAVYGKHTKTVDEQSVCVPITDYAQSKHRAEDALTELSRKKHRASLWILRIAAVVNCSDLGNLTKLVNLTQRTSIVPRVDKGIPKSFVHVDDISEVVARIADNEFPVEPGVYNIVGTPVDLGEVFDVIAENVHHSVRLYVPPSLLSLNKTLSEPVLISNKKAKKAFNIPFVDFFVAFRAEFSTNR